MNIFYQKGTPKMKYQPMFKTEYIFDSKYSMNLIIKAVHNPEMRKKWDTNLEQIKVVNKINRVHLVHKTYKANMLES